MSSESDALAAALPHYEITGELGRGAWGVVFAGRHRRLERPVAIKQLPVTMASDEAVRRRFISEARLLATLDHPHIVPIFDYVEHDAVCLLVMELLGGGSLWHRFQSEGLSMQASCAAALAAATGLHYAHQRGVLHRDIKPENLLFGDGGTLKVTDFGIAKVVGGAATIATRAGEVLGTPTYMSPEQAMGEELGPPTDVYSLGIVLYELLSGALPFPAEGNAMAQLYRRVHETPRPLGQDAPHVPKSVAEVVMQALARDVADRHPTAEQFAIALADAATAPWGRGWVDQSGIVLRAPGAVADRLSNPPVPPASDGGAAPAPGPTWTGLPITPEVAQRSVAETQGVEAVPAGPAAPAAPAGGSGRWFLAAGAFVLVAGILGAVLMRGGDDGENASRGVVTATSSTSTPTTTAPDPRLIFSEDFSDSSSGWAQDDRSDVSYAYAGGEYQIVVKKPLSLLTSDTELEGTAFREDLLTLGDVVIEADMRVANDVSGRMGLMCRSPKLGPPYYVALVSVDGTWQIFRQDKEHTSLASGSLPASVELSRNVPARVSLACVGGTEGRATTFVLRVNGVEVGRAAHAAASPTGRAGLMAESASRAGIDVRVDNLTIRRPG